MEINCSNCNRPNSSDAAFCRHCATPLTGATAQNQQSNYNPPPPQQNQNWNQQNFGGQQQQQQFVNPTQSQTSQKGLISVILVAVGLVLCCGPFTGIPAAILGWMEMTAIKEGRSSKNNMWMAQVGLWGGIVVTILGIVGGFFFMLLSAASNTGY